MTKTVLLAGAAALGFTAGSALAAAGPSLFTHKPVHRFITGVPPGSKTLYDQNKDASGIAVVSQTELGSQAADDFVVPKGHSWQVKGVDVTGIYFNGSGPADSFNVYFYRNKKGKPGRLSAKCENAIYTDSGFGSPDIECKANLSEGTYWVSVQANLDFSQGGEWGWDLSTDTNGYPAVYRDGTCPAWCALESDLMFALKGRDRL